MSLLNKMKRGHGVTIDHDLSTGMSRDIFALDEVNTLHPLFFAIDTCIQLAHYGIHGPVAASSYDSVQSLLAIGTSHFSKWDANVV